MDVIGAGMMVVVVRMRNKVKVSCDGIELYNSSACILSKDSSENKDKVVIKH